MASSKKTVKTGTVTDDQGRVRFHGAFTGGFSAGHYNTVGSVEGFKPAQFVSSRSNRASRNTQSINDFMDEGDGLLGGKLSAVAGIDSFTDSSKPLRPQQDGGQLGDVLSGVIVQQQNDTIGRRLLSTMGWRAGHGIGPRVRRKRINYFDRNISRTVDMEVHPGVDLSKLPIQAQKQAVTFAPDDEAQKIIFPPTKNDLYGLGFDPRTSGRLGDLNYHDENDEEGDSYGMNHNNRYHMNSVLNNRTGAGVPSSSTVLSGKREPPRYGQGQQNIVPASKRLKFSSGFAYDDEEDDVYTSNSNLLQISNNISTSSSRKAETGKEGMLVPYGYDTVEQDAAATAEDSLKQQRFAQNSRNTLSNIHQNVDQWLQKNTASDDLSETLQNSTRCPSDQRLPLPGFHVARIPQTVPPYYPPPEVPKDFIPFHRFTQQYSQTNSNSGNLTLSATQSDRKHVSRKLAPIDAAKARSVAMADTESLSTPASSASIETSKTNSIFDLMKPEARARLQSVIHRVNPESKLHIAATADTAANSSCKPPLPPLPPPPPPPPPSTVHSTADVTVSSITANTTTASSAAVPARPMLTSSHLLNSTFAGLSAAFKNRFAAATTSEGAGTKASIVVEGIATAEEYNKKASELQQSREKAEEDTKPSAQTKSTLLNRSHVRTVTLWAPSPLLCKRMNVKLPDISKTSQQEVVATTVPGGIVDPVSQLLGTNVIAPVAAFGKQGTGSRREDEIIVTEAEAALQDVYQAEETHKPALAVFKSIFEDSDTSDTDSESEQDEEGEHQLDKEGGAIGEKESAVDIVMQNNSSSSNMMVPNSQRRKSADYFNPDSTSTSAGSAAVSVTASNTVDDKNTNEEEEESGPVRWVPNKLRTATGRNRRTIKQQQPMRSRQSFATASDEEQPSEEEGGVQLIRTVKRQADGGSSMNQLSTDNKMLPLDEKKEGEGSDDELFVAVVRRPIAQSVAGIAAVAPGARRGRQQRMQNNPLRQHLLAQQQTDEDDEQVEGTRGMSKADSNRKTSAQTTEVSINSANIRNTQDSTAQFPGTVDGELEAESRRSITSRWNSSSSTGIVQSASTAESEVSPLFNTSAAPPLPYHPLPPPLPVEHAPPPPPLSKHASSSNTQSSLATYHTPEGPAVPPYPIPLTSASDLPTLPERPVALSSAISKLQASLLEPPQRTHDRKAHKHSNKDNKKHKSHKNHKESKHKHKKDKHKHKTHKHKRQYEESDSSNSSSESD